MLDVWPSGKRGRALMLVLTLFVFSNGIFAQAPGHAPTAEPPPYRWPRSHAYDVQHYRLVLSFDWAHKSVIGETTITLRPFSSDVKEIQLDAGHMTIHSVTLADGTPLQFRYQDDEKLFVTLDRAYPAGQDIAITINYTAVPREGLTFVTPTESEPDRPYQIWTAGQPEANHYWFPCYDYPNDRASAEVIATVEDEYTVISNGALVSVTPHPENKTKTWHWKLDEPFSSYLISIVVGRFAELKDRFKNIPVISYVYPDQVENARLSFGKLKDMVAFFSQKLGYDYPYPKYAQTTVRGFPGGLENISATTLGDNFVHDRRAHLDISSDGVVSHELAHQWFGDLLTCRDWGEIWLNESFATFMANVWTEHDKGKEEYLYEMFGNQRQYFQAWRRGNRRPIVTKRYDNPWSMFDTHAYPHGAAVLNMLRFVLGEERFWRAIHHYVEKYAWQNVETPQLVIAIEEATGQNLQWFFDEWVYKMGHPRFEIASQYDERAHKLTLTVTQTQKPDETRPWFQSPDVFVTPVDIAITTASGESVHRVWIDERQETFTFPVDGEPLIINFDRGNYILKEVKFDRDDAAVAYQLLHDRDVTGRIRAAVELASRSSDAVIEALTEAALHDAFWGVRLEAVRALAGKQTEAARAALLKALKDEQSRVRRAAIRGLAALKDPKLADLFVTIIRTDPSYFAVAEAARALGQSRAPQAYDVLVDLMKRDSWQDVIRAGAMDGLAALQDPRALDVAMEYAAPGHRATVRSSAFRLLGAIGKENDRVLDILLKGLKEGIRNRSFQLGFGAAQALGALGDRRALPALEEAARTPGLPSFARSIITNAINRIKKAEERPEEKKEQSRASRQGGYNIALMRETCVAPGGTLPLLSRASSGGER